MSESAVYRPHPEAPARATLSPYVAKGAWKAFAAERFEVVSRGDFVPGILYRPSTSSDDSVPLLLLQHGTGETRSAEGLEFAAAWVEEGFAIATLDLPLHGERSSPKLSERLQHGIQSLDRGENLDPETHALVEEFARQSTSDLIRTIDALSALPGIDANRVAFVGFGVGARVGSYVLAADARPRAAVLVDIRGGVGPEDLDPARHLARAAEVSLLFVSAKDDEQTALEAVASCFDAAAKPKSRIEVPSRATPLPSSAIDEIQSFIDDAIGR